MSTVLLFDYQLHYLYCLCTTGVQYCYLTINFTTCTVLCTTRVQDGYLSMDYIGDGVTYNGRGLLQCYVWHGSFYPLYLWVIRLNTTSCTLPFFILSHLTIVTLLPTSWHTSPKVYIPLWLHPDDDDDVLYSLSFNNRHPPAHQLTHIS